MEPLTTFPWMTKFQGKRIAEIYGVLVQYSLPELRVATKAWRLLGVRGKEVSVVAGEMAERIRTILI